MYHLEPQIYHLKSILQLLIYLDYLLIIMMTLNTTLSRSNTDWVDQEVFGISCKVLEFHGCRDRLFGCRGLGLARR